MRRFLSIPQRCHHVTVDSLKIGRRPASNQDEYVTLTVKSPCVGLARPYRKMLVGGTLFLDLLHASEGPCTSCDSEPFDLQRGPFGSVRRVIVGAAELRGEEYVHVDLWLEVP